MTSNSTELGARVWELPQQLRALRPESTQWLDRVNGEVWATFDRALLELIRLRIARLIGNSAGESVRGSVVSEEKVRNLSSYFSSELYSSLERECLAFVEQFVIDVSGTTSQSLEQLASALPGHDVADFVRAVFVVEFTQRLQMMADALLDPRRSPGATVTTAVPEPEAVDASLHDLLRVYQESVVRGRVMDPITTELVRLRCARTHNCRICQTLRLADARQAGADDTMTAKIDRYEQSDLPERSKVALRITDAFIVGAEAPPEHLRQQARHVFTQLELASLCLDITKWSTQKVHVALGTDGADRLPLNEQGVSYFDFAADGKVAGFRAE